MAVQPATIAFLIEHEEGHLNPTFRLARRLAARSHRVVYLGLADGGGFVRSQGFEFIPILEEIFPRGTMRTLREMMRTAPGVATEERSAEIGTALQAIPDTPYARTWKGLLEAGPELDRTVGELRPDLFVLTSLFVPHALVLRSRFRLPVVLLTPLLRTQPKSEYAVEVLRLMKELGEPKERVGALLAGAGPAIPGAGLAQRLLVQVLRMRELILCPSDFELPEQSWEREPEVFYVEPTVDLERRPEGAFPWQALDPSRRLLYVSLGSQSHRAGHERVVAFLRAVAVAFADRPEWQVVLSTGGLLEPGEILAPPGGIVIGWAPQLELLDRAAVAVTHGGLGTVKECIVRGVPMAVFPIDHDQPDNARRVVHHGLGVSGDLGSFSAAGIAALVEQADRPAVRESLARMRRRFLDIEGSGIGVRLIEELLAQDQQKRGQDGKGIRENRTAQSV
jgi:zeaxanthin glucosyltransferase